MSGFVLGYHSLTIFIKTMNWVQSFANLKPFLKVLFCLSELSLVNLDIQIVLVMCLLAGVLSLITISFDRFIAFVFPFKRHLNRKVSYVIIAAIWALAIILSSPLAVWRIYHERTWQDFVEVCLIWLYSCKYNWMSSIRNGVQKITYTPLNVTGCFYLYFSFTSRYLWWLSFTLIFYEIWKGMRRQWQ